MQKPNYRLLHRIGIWDPYNQKYHLLRPDATRIASWHLDANYDVPRSLFDAVEDLNTCVRAGIVFG